MLMGRWEATGAEMETSGEGWEGGGLTSRPLPSCAETSTQEASPHRAQATCSRSLPRVLLSSMRSVSAASPATRRPVLQVQAVEDTSASAEAAKRADFSSEAFRPLSSSTRASHALTVSRKAIESSMQDPRVARARTAASVNCRSPRDIAIPSACRSVQG